MPSRKVAPITSPSSTPTRTPSVTSPKPSPRSTPIAKPMESINVVKLLSKAKFPVYLALSPTRNQYFALKLFPFEDDEPHPYFQNESRFAVLNHPNVIRFHYLDESTTVSSKGQPQEVSCILMEYAPNGDLFDFVKVVRQNFTEKLARTYFRQLIEGIEHLHKNNVYHLDLKLENLLLGDYYQLKIADFDLSYMKGDSKILTKGTKYYRAPELRAARDGVNASVDIYAAGIILFVMRCGGFLPQMEDQAYRGIDLFKLMSESPAEFFETHCLIQERESSFFSDSFRELFSSMVKVDPSKRISIQEIKRSRWYNGSVYSAKELKKKAIELLSSKM